MPQLIITYWRDIPTMVVAKQGRTSAKRELSSRFGEAVDMAAMRGGAAGTDDYLSEFHRSPPIECGDDLEAEVSAAAAKIEAEYDKERLAALAKNGGKEIS
ncbi:virulence factor [Labrys neptuniae]